MAELKIMEIARVVEGQVLNARDDTCFVDYHFDSRLIDKKNTLFFALKSDKNDGHRFLPQLAGKEGIGAVVNRDYDVTGIDYPLIIVDDSLIAAQQLAAYVREKFRHIKFIGITGSAGKTTTKEFIYQILSGKYKAYRSYGNWNNWIGMPFSLLKLTGEEEVAVFELAMSYPGIGEIDLLAGLLRPDLAILLNAYPTHLEFLKTVENVAAGKSEILNYLEADQVAFVNGDASYVRDACAGKKGKSFLFGRSYETNDILLKEVVSQGGGNRLVIDFFGIEASFETSIINGNHIENLFAAIIAAQQLGMKNYEIQQAVAHIKPLQGRGDIRTHKDITLIDETYNSNPEAVKKTLSWVDARYEGEKIAVLGDMLELGELEDDFHRQVGEYFASLSYSLLLAVGPLAHHIVSGAKGAGFPGQNIKHFDKAGQAGKFLAENVKSGSVVLFKASRGIRLEEAIREFINE